MGAGFALIAIGAILAFTFTGEILGIDVDIIGVILMIAGALALAFGLLRALRAQAHRPD